MRILQSHLKDGVDRLLQERMIGWARAEGWNPCVDDLNHFQCTDPAGFFFGLSDAEREENDAVAADPNKQHDRVVSCVIGAIFDSDFAYIHYYLCQPDFRGKGYGLPIFNAAMCRLGSHRNVGLDAVLKQITNYQKHGFKECWRNFMFRGKIPQQIGELLATNGVKSEASVRLFEASRDLPALLEMDRRNYGGCDRSRFLTAMLIGAKGMTGVAAVVATKITENNVEKLLGFAMLRPGLDMLRVGPWQADDPLIANELLCELLKRAPAGCLVACDAPAINPHSINLLRDQLKWETVFETARMYTKGIPGGMRTERIFSVLLEQG